MADEDTAFDAEHAKAAMDTLEDVMFELHRMASPGTETLPAERIHRAFQMAGGMEAPFGLVGGEARAARWIMEAACKDGPPRLRYQAGAVRLAEREALLRGPVSLDRIVDDLLK